jgi:hypothetical protein
MEDPTPKHTVFEELLAFRLKVPKEKLRQWEQPEGWESLRLV